MNEQPATAVLVRLTPAQVARVAALLRPHLPALVAARAAASKTATKTQRA